MNLRNLILDENQIEILICDNYHNILLNLEEYIDDILDIGLLFDFSNCTNVTNINDFEYNTIQIPINDCIDSILNKLVKIKKHLKDESSYTQEAIKLINDDFTILLKFYEILKKYNKPNYSFTVIGLDDMSINTITDFKIKNLCLAIKKYRNKRDKYKNLDLTNNFINKINKVIKVLKNKDVFEDITLDEDSIRVINMDKHKTIIKFDFIFKLKEDQLLHIEKDIFLINFIEELETLKLGWDNKSIDIEEDLIMEEYYNSIKLSFYKIIEK